MLAQQQLPRHRLLSCGAIALFCIIFVAWHHAQLYTPEDNQYLREVVFPYLQYCEIHDVPTHRAPFKIWMLCASDRLFGSISIIPFAVAVALIPMTYLVAHAMTRSRVASVVAAGMVLGSNIIGYMGSTATYSADWVLLLLLSILLIYRSPLASGAVYFLSIAAKGMSLVVLPALLYWIWRDGVSRRKVAVVSLSGAVGAVLAVWSTGNTQLLEQEIVSFRPHMLEPALYNMYYIFRNDPHQIPIIIAGCAAFYSDRRFHPMLWFCAMYAASVLIIPVFTVYDMYDYRMIPLIILGNIGFALAIHRIAMFLTHRRAE